MQGAAIAVSAGSLSLASLALPYVACMTALGGLFGSGSALRLEAVTVLHDDAVSLAPDAERWVGPLTGTVAADGTTDPPGLLADVNRRRSIFEVVS
eukprot:SAG11_NODE_16586_length_543_cov_1.506757_1_plen_95_part_10